MTEETPTPSDSKELLFLSYAYEDQVFARWLARKLAFYGYGVWFDQIKLLGGESWVKDVDLAIKNHSFRVLGLLSESSVEKENPRKERTLALQLAKAREIDDFLITLNLDGSSPDWTLSDISWISFRDSWADGLRRLLKKLDAIEAPRIHEGKPEIARAELDRGDDLVSEETEEVIINWLPFSDLPETIRIYDAPGLDRDDREPWPSFYLGDGKVAALSPPPAEIADEVTETPEVHYWPSVGEIRRSSSHTIIVVILNQMVRKWFTDAGCLLKGKGSGTVAYLPDPFRDEAIWRYEDAEGTKRRINASGKMTLRKPSGPPEKVIHHPGVYYRTRKIDSGGYVLELKPALALFDEKGEPIIGRRVGPRRKKVARSWYNFDWRKRLMAFVQVLTEEAAKDELTPFSLGRPIRLTADRSLHEAGLELKKYSEADDSHEEVVEIGMEEMEEWQE